MYLSKSGSHAQIMYKEFWQVNNETVKGEDKKLVRGMWKLQKKYFYSYVRNM